MATYKITVSLNSGTGGTSAFYYDTGTAAFYTSTALTERITRIDPPTLECFLFLGCYSSNATSGTLRVAGDGVIQDGWRPTAATTIYAQWKRVSWKVTLSDNSGSGGVGAIYCRVNSTGDRSRFWMDDMCLVGPVVSVLEKPTRASYAYEGYYNGTSTLGSKYVDKDGVFTDAFFSLSITAAKTIYARWVAPYKITVSVNSGSGGTGSFYFDSVSGNFYSAADMATRITRIEPPTRECYALLGIMASNSDTAAVRVDPDGTIADGWVPTAAATIYARWSLVSYKITVNAGGGTGGTAAFYCRAGSAAGAYDRFCSDDQCENVIDRIAMPSRTGYILNGCFSASSGGTVYIDAEGVFNSGLYGLSITAAKTVYAQWQGKTYVLRFRYAGGSESTESKIVTFGSAVGTLPSTSRSHFEFVGWFVGETKITATSVWDVDGDALAVAVWDPLFGRVTDWFSLASANLVPIASDSGDNKKRICVCNATGTGSSQANAGRYSSGVDHTGGIWRNPSVTYRVVGDLRFQVNLGKAYAKNGTNVSGYMIVEVAAKTVIGEFPTITVSAVANEGANAINQFAVDFNIEATAHAQNLMSAVSGGGVLQECSLLARAEPVVCAENLMPCASDVVKGRVEVSAETIAPDGESAPTAGTGFTSVGEPVSTSDGVFPSYKIKVQKEIV